MVLPASAPAHAPGQGVERWIEEIRAGLRLSPAGVLILVDGAVPEQLGKLVRSLLIDHPGLEVLVDVADLEPLRDGSVVVLAPPAQAAGWLNEHRPMFARKALKVVLWCDRETSAALAHEAPDFFDWIAQRQECPPGLAEHAVWGLRKALYARSPGVLFVCEPLGRERFEVVFRAALPGRRLVWLEPEETPYSDLVDQIRAARNAWVACLSWTYGAAERFRWALAEVGRQTRAVLVVPQGGEDRFWHVTDRLWSLEESVKLLSRAGARHPGRLAAVSGLEAAAVFGLLELLIRDYDEEDLLRSMLRSPDPGAGLGERMSSSGIEGPALQGWLMPGPVQRRLGKRIGLRRRASKRPSRKADGWLVYDGPSWPFLRSRANRIEYYLCAVPRTAETWTRLARLALDHGDSDVAAAWAVRSLELRDSTEARRLFGVARAELGLFNWDHGHPAGVRFIAQAMRALDDVAAMLTAETPPEDVLATHALRAYLLARFGFPDEADEALAAAASLLDSPKARTGDLLRLARALMRRGRHTRAEEIVRAALERASDEEQRREGLVLLGECALALGRPAEAETISAKVLQGLPQASDGWDAGKRIEAERLHIDALLAREEVAKALSFADEAVRASVPWWEALSPHPAGLPHQAVWRLPLFARVLRRGGRVRDAELLLRKVLGLPISDDPASIGAGLASQRVLQAFVGREGGALQMIPELRASLVSELVRALRAQGRYAEAEELSRA